jgi:two-component system CitB family sensor kinase
VRWIRGGRTLSARLLAGHVVVLLLAGAVGFGLWAHALRGRLDAQYEQRALAVAAATATTPQVVSALTEQNPAGVQALAEQIRKATRASYVVVIDRTGVRYSHPNPALIGKRIEESVVALDGHTHVGIDPGSLGRSANGKAPVFGAGGRPVGEVSAGVLEKDVSAQAVAELDDVAVYLAVGAVVGLLVSVLLARRLKRQTFGLELDEIAALVQEREATLHGIREGVVAVDATGRLTLINDEAHLLLRTTPSAIGLPVSEVIPDAELRARLFGPTTAAEVTDVVALHAGRVIVGSRREVRHGARVLGYVVTLRDRTDLEQALRELDENRTLTDALRAQQHEFSNRMHVISGLLELGRYDEAIGYATQIDQESAELAGELADRIDDPRVVGLLIAKTTVARERGITLDVQCSGQLRVASAQSAALVSIIGNLLDNALEAVTGTEPAPRWVRLLLAASPTSLRIEASDSGPGIPAGAAEAIFSGGWTTKLDPDGRQRGLGLTLVRELVRGLGGEIAVEYGAGARFVITLPIRAPQVTP